MPTKSRSALAPTWPETTLAAFIACSAIDTDRTGSWLIIESVRLLLLIGLVVWLVGCTTQRRVQRPLCASQIQVRLLGVWILWASLTALILSDVRSFGVVGGFAVVLAASCPIIDQGGRPAAAKVLGLGLVFYLGAAGLLVLTSDVPPFLGDRLTLISLEANQLARVASLGGIAGLWFARESRGLGRVVGLITAATGGALVIATASRTSALGLALVLALLAVHSARRRLAATALGLVLLLVAIALSGASGSFDGLPISGLIGRLNGSVQEFGGRSYLWPLVIDLVGDSPVVGIGLGNDRDLVAALPVGWTAQHAHNLVLHLALTTGVIGAALLLGAIAISLVKAVAKVDPLALGLMTFVLVNGISEPVMRVPAFGWFAVCAAAELSGQTSNSASRREA